MALFVLTLGAWPDGSAWEVMVRHLESRGHKTFAPTVAGHGKGANKNFTHAQGIHSIVKSNTLFRAILPLADKLDLKKFYSLQILRSYLHCTEGIALPPGEYGWLRGCPTGRGTRKRLVGFSAAV